MSKRLWLACLIICLSACAGAPAAAPTSAATATPAPRSAVLSELKNQVQAHTSEADAWQAATEGQTLHVKGGAKTLAESRVRIDLSDGTLIRLGNDTQFTLADLSPAAADPVTRLQLAAGQLWVSVTKALGAGSFDVETPVGVAGVRGSMMGVAYDPALQLMTVTCVEGACTIASANAPAEALAPGEQAEIGGSGQPPAPKHAIALDQYTAWQQYFPEAAALLLTITPMPALTATPVPPTETPAPTQTPSPTVNATARTQAAAAGQRATAVPSAPPVPSAYADSGATVAPWLGLSPEEQANDGTFTYTFTATYSANCSGVTSGTRHIHLVFAKNTLTLDWLGQVSTFHKTGANTYQATDATGITLTLVFTLDGFTGGGGCAKWVFKK